MSKQGLQEEKTLFQTVLNSTPDAMIGTNESGLICAFNAGAERLFGHRREHLQGQPLDCLMPARFRAHHAAYLQQFAATGVGACPLSLGPLKGLRADGQEIYLDATLSNIVVQHQPVLICHLVDITARRQCEAQLKRAQSQLSALTQKLLKLEKTLAKRLSQALHDQLGQTLAAIRMAHETVLTLQGDPVPPAVVRLQAQMGQKIGLAVREVRQVLVDLRPPLLDEQGLGAALEHTLRTRSLTCPSLDLDLHIQAEIAHTRYPCELEYAAFMVIREALDNALKHAKASAISVRLSGTPQAIHLVVADNGTGISLKHAPQPGHFGILGMHERAQAVGAFVSFGAVSPSGTCVEFVWNPFEAQVPV